MSRLLLLSAATLSLLVCSPALFAQSSSSSTDSMEALGVLIKPLLIDALPRSLYASTQDWGHQAMVPVGLKWQGLKATVQKSPRNHGEWRRLFITAQDLKRTLDLRVYDVKTVNAEKQTFKVFLTFQMGVDYEQQNWASGIRLWSGSVRARTQVKLIMDCENIVRFETGKDALPDMILRARATNAKLSYDKLVIEHINGIGGDGAKLIGAAVHKVVKKARPPIERDLLAKANAAIVKAADTKEVRLSFGSLLKTK